MKWQIEISGAVFSIIFAVIIWKIIIVPLSLPIAITLGAIFFSAYIYLLEYREIKCCLPFLKSGKFVFAALVILGVFCVLLIDPYSDSIASVAWDSISTLMLLRLLLSSFLLLFSPGFMVVSILDRSHRLKLLEKIFFAISTSLLIIPFFGILSFSFGSSIRQITLVSIIVLNLSLLLPYIILKSKKTANKTHLNLNETIILVLLLCFIVIQFLSKYSSNLTWDFNDQDYYYGSAVAFTKDSLPVSPIGPGLNYPFWSFVFFAQFFVFSGFPYINAFQFILIPLSFLPVISFYIMTSAFFKRSTKSKIPIVATLFSFFGGGFGWLFSANLIFGNQTIQNWFTSFEIMADTNSGYLTPAFYSTGMQFVFFAYALSSIFALIWLIYSKRSIELGNIRYFLISIITALGYLSHVAEIAIFSAIFSASILIFKRQNLPSFRKYGISILFGLLLVVLSDVILQGSFYTLGQPIFTDQAAYPSSFYVLTIYFGSIAFLTLAVALSFVKDRLKFPNLSIRKCFVKMKNLKAVLSLGVIYFYGLCLIIWASVYLSHNRLPTVSHIVPWYGWANRLGVCGLISLIALLYLINRSKSVKEYTFFLFLPLSTFVIARIIHISPFYYEDRITFLIMIPVIIASSFVLLKTATILKQRLTRKRILLFGTVFLAISLFGFLPYSLLSIGAMDLGYWSEGQKLSTSEMEALNFIRLNTPSNCSVLTLSENSRWSRWYLDYAGLSPSQVFYLDKDSSIVFSPFFPETTINSLVKSQIKYIYSTTANEEELELTPDYLGFTTSYLIEYLPIVLKNEEVTIYEVPLFSTTTSSSTGLVTSNLKHGYEKNAFYENDAQYLRSSDFSETGDVIIIKTKNVTGENHDLRLPVSINPDNYPYLEIRWKTDESNLVIYLNGSKDVYYLSLGSSINWKTTVINLKYFYDIVKERVIGINNDTINTLFFRKLGENTEYSIDYIRFSGFLKNDYSINFIQTLPALSQIEYSIVMEDDPSRFNYSTLIIPNDLNLLNYAESQNFQQYLQWVNSGGTLIVIDSLGNSPSYEINDSTVAYSGFANLLSIYYETSTQTDGIQSQTRSFNFPLTTIPVYRSSSEDTETIAYYTLKGTPVSSCAFTKNVGSGKIIYLELYPYLQEIENSSSEARRNLFENAGLLLNMLDIGLRKNVSNWTNYFPQFEYIKNPVFLEGRVSIATDYVRLQEFSASKITIVSNNGEMVLGNSIMKNIDYDNSVRFNISASEVNLHTLSLGGYPTIEVQNFVLEIEIPENGLLNLSILNGKTLLNKEFQEGAVQLNIESFSCASISVKKPIIAVEGEAYFDKARIFRSNYSMPLWYDDGTNPFEVIGNITFTVTYADNGLSFIDNLEFEGDLSFSGSQKAETLFNEFDIPWLIVITSPLHISLVALVLAVLVYCFYLKNKYRYFDKKSDKL